MAKKASATSSFKASGSPTLYTLRKVLGLKAKKASDFNRCIGAELEGKKYAKPAVGMGGRHNAALQADFIKAKTKCQATSKKALAGKAK